MRRALLAVTLVLLAAVSACGDDAPTPSASPDQTTPACDATKPPAPEKQTAAERPAMRIDKSATYRAVLRTSCGNVVWEMPAGKAPETVNSFSYLAGRNYFDGSWCHRMTAAPTLTVLQCGDPTGTGSGGPGYGLPEENLPTADARSGIASYPRGTLAMARTPQPGSGGSQFFLVIRDSQLPPDYTVFGHVVSGLEVLDRIAALGIDSPTGQPDGAPARRVFIEDFTVEKQAAAT